MPYADVCVNTPLGRGGGTKNEVEFDPLQQTFTYAVPDWLAGRLQPGHLVWAPFRGRRLQAVVLTLSDAPPDFTTQYIDSLVWAQPLLTPPQIALAYWISAAYLAPLIESLRLMLPAGLSQRGRPVLVRTAAPAPRDGAIGLTPTQAALLAAVEEHKGRGAWAEVSKGLRGVTQKADLQPLLAMGLVAQEVAFPAPPRPKTDRQVRLLADAETVARVLPTLGRRQRHKAVLDALLKHDGPAWIGWVYGETGATLSTLRDLEAAGLITVAEEMVWRDPLAGRQFALDQPPALTDDQEQVWAAVAQRIAQSQSAGRETGRPGSVMLLHGVTGSGKTEIYLRAIAETLERGRQATVLVPEIALTPQTIRRFAARFPGRVTVWHSELGEGERFDVWRRVCTNHGAAQVVVGSRSALFLPFPDLGLIVLDEEHEPSYKQERTPRYHARTVALELGRLCSAPVLLGSATPALETFYAARQGEIELLTLAKRVLGHRDSALSPLVEETTALPEVRVVDMRQELRASNRSIFSRALASGLRHVLAAGQQAILYLNRRGAATFVMCRDCGHVEVCRRCATPLTYHTAGEMLLCHRCNRRYPVPATCPECESKRIRFFGAGTENVEEAVKLEFPEARTLRWDRDVTGAKGSHDAILARFVAHEADVLIGTQMIAKGLDLPLVTLVGVIAADVGLFLPDFRASERTFQLLTQVAGRAGRSALGGQVVVQTYHPDHYAVIAASRHDYEDFYRQEMAFRREQGYPPIRRLARLVYYHSKRSQAQAEATRMAELLRGEIARLALTETDVIGPAPCFFSMQRGEYRWQVIVRSPDPALLLRHAPAPLGWRLDIDPVDLL